MNTLSNNNAAQNTEPEVWDQVIEARRGLLDINLKEIWNYRDLLFLFVKRDFASQYKQTVLGPIWHVVQPIITTAMFMLIFTKIANIPTDGVEPILFYMSGISIWNYFAACLHNTSNTFVANSGIFGKVYFPRMVLPLSSVASNIIRFLIQFGLLLILMIYFAFKGVPIPFNFGWLLLPILLLLMAGIGLGVGIIISSLTTKYRDFGILVSFGVQLLMYATPIAYPLSFLQDKSFGWLLSWNPLTAIVECYRHILFQTPSFDYGTLIYSVLFMLVVLVVGTIVFNKVERTFMDTV